MIREVWIIMGGVDDQGGIHDQKRYGLSWEVWIIMGGMDDHGRCG